MYSWGLGAVMGAQPMNESRASAAWYVPEILTAPIPEILAGPGVGLQRAGSGGYGKAEADVLLSSIPEDHLDDLALRGR
jgi:hypothetical protein